MQVTREALLAAPADEVWAAIADDERRAGWLDDDRPIEVLSARAGHSITWRWCGPGETGVRSTVTIELDVVSDGCTRVTVTERAAASSCSLGAPTVEVDAWDRRLVGLELRLLTDRALAPVV